MHKRYNNCYSPTPAHSTNYEDALFSLFPAALRHYLVSFPSMRILPSREPVLIVYYYVFYFPLGPSYIIAAQPNSGNCNIPQPHVYYYKWSVVGSVDLHGRIISAFLISNLYIFCIGLRSIWAAVIMFMLITQH